MNFDVSYLPIVLRFIAICCCSIGSSELILATRLKTVSVGAFVFFPIISIGRIPENLKHAGGSAR